ncbi:MAG: hypothetical protein UY98_C0038G0005 [Candidatus Kaiserbacteria bacterium GW2011_GWA2_58_9]|uniref:Uncharacterized protein n=1 Tax=Candidatus Kaiserbacteria bacterium GW2011_GWA2_58_9 TaxID=1618672 RepID=A0A0G2BJ41_9BACT|nr:MAG: hypothetical protein UY98_C0038G0005 [Candidatus Kaiserbacteria bacterium GW2011_GWA2_58_9]
MYVNCNTAQTEPRGRDRAEVEQDAAQKALAAKGVVQ